jgi:hypothetical protein
MTTCVDIKSPPPSLSAKEKVDILDPNFDMFVQQQVYMFVTTFQYLYGIRLHHSSDTLKNVKNGFIV